MNIMHISAYACTTHQHCADNNSSGQPALKHYYLNLRHFTSSFGCIFIDTADHYGNALTGAAGPGRGNKYHQCPPLSLYGTAKEGTSLSIITYQGHGLSQIG